MARVFKAKYRSGLCPECGNRIEAGEEVSYLMDELLHAECNYRSVWDDDDLLGEFEDLDDRELEYEE